MTTASVAGSQSWYRSLDANQWKTMIASNLGWAFDGYETFSLILVVGVALHDLLDPSQFAQIPAFAGTVPVSRYWAGASAGSSAACWLII